MRMLVVAMTFLVQLGALGQSSKATARIYKVLPQYLDRKGRHTLSPSLFERDAYQAYLRGRLDLSSALRFEIHWKVKGDVPRTVTVRMEVRIAKDAKTSIEVLEKRVPVKGRFFSHWTSLTLDRSKYANGKEIVAWRARILDGAKTLGQQVSFLW